MPIDKSWINKPRNTIEYANGLTKFLDFAFEHKSIEGHGGRKIVCPCSECGWKKWLTRDEVGEHLTCRPFPVNYKVWSWHGEEPNGVESRVSKSTHVIQETLQPQNPMENMINDAFGFSSQNLNDVDASSEHSSDGNNETHDEDMYELLKENN